MTDIIARIDKELADLWTLPADPTEIPKSRVRTMNLEVVAESQDLRDRYTSVVDEVTAAIPSRAILVSIEPDAPGDELEGSATAVCSLEGDRQICSERITLSAKGRACARSASAVQALLVPELPTVLVWLGRINVYNTIFEDLAESADRIVIDSEYTSLSSLLRVAAWARKHRASGGPKLADLAWTRLGPWQELLARLFDDAQHLATKITRLELVQVSDEGAPLGPEPGLLMGWIATRLGWKISQRGSTLSFTRPDGDLVAFKLGAISRPLGVAPETLAALIIEAQDGDLKATGRIVRELASGRADETPDADMVLWQREITGARPIEQRVRLGSNKAAIWLEQVLHRRPHDPAFDESVAFVEHAGLDGLVVGG
ncbi:MAG: glucose-6-phosphate dehydrogenase assembly protein OpcA [Polyangiaceae bacterium]|nr:glucose-6-phosphate dehydrogenase assembly protein OpcA [Polyangiaceae bacterium]